MFTRKIRAGVLSLSGAALALGAASGGAQAETATSDFLVSAHVTASCSLNAGALDFGPYDPLVANVSNDLLAQSSISVTCTNLAPATIALSSGGSPTTGTGATRRLTDGAAHFLTYSLYTDTTRTAAWGDGTLAPTLVYTGTGAQDTLTVFGKVESNQKAAAGTYSDTVTATITF
jgi:spore coat protein U-like protein